MSRRKKTGRDIHGILLLDKRLGVSSNKALQEVKFLYKANKAGHTGSLDPLATGLLPVCFGEATKVSALLLDQDKTYRVVIRLGVTTDTGDREGSVLSRKPVPQLNNELVTNCLNKFTGQISQVPPMYSALKHQGKRLYELARSGKTVERRTRTVSIHQLQCLAYNEEYLTLDVSCSKGTYIRTLAEDIGMYFGCGATVNDLRRLKVGQFNIENAYTFEKLQQMDSEVSLLQLLRPVDEPLLTWPAIELLPDQADDIKQGRQVPLADVKRDGLVRMYIDDIFLGIGEVFSDGKLAPKRLFNINEEQEFMRLN